MYEAPGAADGVFDLEVMGRIATLTEAIEDEVPFLYEVTSLANAELVTPTDDGIAIREVWRDFPHTREAMQEARALFLAKPQYVGGLVTADGRFGAISIDMDRTSTDPPERIRLDPNAEHPDALDNLYPQVTSEKIEEILARPEYAGLRFYHSGDVPLNTAYNRIIEHENGFLQMISSAVIGVVLALFFRSVVGVLGPLAIVQIAVIATVAFVALAGWKLDMMFGSVPNLLVTVGVAEAVHILVEFRTLFARLGDRREAIVQTLYLVGAPCLLTSMTTAVGFLALQVSPIVAISHMAVYSAVGVVLAFALTMTLLPALLSFGPRTPQPRAAGAERGGAVARARPRARSRPGTCATAAPCSSRSRRSRVFSLAGIARLRVDSNWLDDFSERVPLKGATTRIDEVMGGMSNLVYVFDTGREDGIRDPEVLRAIERVQREAERHDFLVKKAYSIVDIVKDLNQSFHEGDPAYYAIPDDRELVSQLLLLYETSGGDEVEEWATTDFSRANLELRLRIAPISHTDELVQQLDRFLAEHPTPGVEVQLTGIGALWLELLDYIVSSQIESFLYAFALIGAMMCFIFRLVQDRAPVDGPERLADPAHARRAWAGSGSRSTTTRS